ncbi:MAG: hypothetical protein Kow00109_22900 [Acidobacteriota bacterium]
MIFANNEQGEDWIVRLDGEEVQRPEITIGAGESREFVVSGDDLGVGWLKVRSNVPLVGHLFYRVRAQGSGAELLEVPILPVRGRQFRTALAPGRNDQLALALVNLATEPVTVHVEILENETEWRLTSRRGVELQPGEHVASFLSEFLGSEVTIPSDFRGGTLTIRATAQGAANLAATVIKTRNGLPLAILPVIAE